MQIISDKKFDKHFKKLSPKIKKEFERRMNIFIKDINNPVLNIHKLSGGDLRGLWSFNLSGDIRVVFDKINKDTIILIDVGSHSELYS
jgi:addiction module RelE/StbE family toxin